MNIQIDWIRVNQQPYTEKTGSTVLWRTFASWTVWILAMHTEQGGEFARGVNVPSRWPLLTEVGVLLTKPHHRGTLLTGELTLGVSSP